jgi:hypothetical protein
VITRARYEEIALFSHISCLEKCDVLFSEAGMHGYITALDIRKLKQLLYELLYEFEFHRLSQTFTSYERLLKDLVYSIFLPTFAQSTL